MRLNDLRKDSTYYTDRDGKTVPVVVISVYLQTREAFVSVGGGRGELWSAGRVQRQLRKAQ